MKKKLFIVSAAIFALSAYCLAAEPAPCEGLNPHKPYLENFESYGPTCTYTLTPTKGCETSPSWWEKALTPTCWTVGNEKLGTDPSVCTSTERAYFPFIFSNGSVTINTTTGVVTKTNYYDKGTALTIAKYAPEGCNALKMATSTSYGIVWAALPELKGSDEDMSSLVISASAKFTKATATIPHALIVGIMDDPTDLSTFVVLDSIATGAGIAYNNPAQKIEVSVIEKGYSGKGRYVAFRTAYNPNASSTAKYKVCATTVYLDSVALRVEPFYAQNNWETESDWSWKQMARTAENIYKVDSVVFGGLGINFNDTADTPDATWVAASDFKGDAVQAKDTVSFTYNTSTKEVTMTLIGRPAAPVVPQIVVVYDMQGHGEAIENDTINSGDKLTKPKARDNQYYFVGWFKENTFKNQFDFDVPVTAAQDSTFTLYARWASYGQYSGFTEDDKQGFDLCDNISVSVTGNPTIDEWSGALMFSQAGSLTINAKPGCSIIGFEVTYRGMEAQIKLGQESITSFTTYPLDSVTTFTLTISMEMPNSPQRMATNDAMWKPMGQLSLGSIKVMYYEPTAAEKYGRKLNAKGNFGTICLAKKITSMEGVEGLFVPYEQNETTLFCEEVALTDLVFGGSYIFKAKAEADSVTFTYEGESAAYSANNDHMIGWLSKDHILTDKEINSSSWFYGYYLLANNQITKPLDGSEILKYRAMIIMDKYNSRGVPTKAEAPARGRLISFSLNDVNTPTGLMQNAECTMQSGKMMINGQLIIMKNGKMFNAQGQEL